MFHPLNLFFLVYPSPATFPYRNIPQKKIAVLLFGALYQWNSQLRIERVPIQLLIKYNEMHLDVNK